MHTTSATSSKYSLRRLSGFTLVELLIAMGIFVFVAVLSVTIFAQIIRSQTATEAKRNVQEESRFLLEKIVKEFRNGTIDFPQYHADHWSASYREYQALPPDETHPPSINDGNFPPGSSPNHETVLNIIATDGKNQTKIMRNDASDTVEIQRLTSCLDVTDDVQWEAITGSDYDDPASPTPLFLPMHPGTIKVTDLSFFIFPLKDPNKVYGDDKVQYQPTVIIHLAATSADGSYSVELQTTATSSLYDEAQWDTTITNDCEV